MVNLDDLRACQALDRSNMRGHLHAFGDQCAQGWDAARTFHLPDTYRDIDRIVFAGVGGSAIIGDALAELAGLEDAPLVYVHRDYGLPLWVDERTLVITSSYSGGTEETLSSFLEAQTRGLKTVAVTSGGRLGRLAREQRVPLCPIALEAPPRVTFGYTLLSLLHLLMGLGLLRDHASDVEDAKRAIAGLTTRLDASVPGDRNPAKALAHDLHGTIPVVCAGGILSVAARRWKTQLNENAKTWAFAEVLPEMDHNSTVASLAPWGLRERVHLVFLRSSHIPHRVLARYDLTERLFTDNGVSAVTVDALGESPLAHILTTVLYGDWVSLYLALLNDVDPTPVEPIDALKEQLVSQVRDSLK